MFVRGSVCVLLLLLVMPSTGLAQQPISAVQVQEEGTEAVLQLAKLGEERSKLGSTLSFAYTQVRRLRRAISLVANDDDRLAFYARLQSILVTLDATKSGYDANGTTYFDAGLLDYNAGCVEEALANASLSASAVQFHRSEAVRLYRLAAAAFRSGIADAQALTINAEADLALLNELAAELSY